jgi:hypothetical protein
MCQPGQPGQLKIYLSEIMIFEQVIALHFWGNQKKKTEENNEATK